MRPAVGGFLRRGRGRHPRRSLLRRVVLRRMRHAAQGIGFARSQSARRGFQSAFHIRGAQDGQAVQQGQTVARRRNTGRVLQMQYFGHGIQLTHLQEHHFAPGRALHASDREAQPLAGLGLTAQADPQAAQRQIFQHNAAILKNAGKGHDAACAVHAHPGLPLCRHIGGQPGAIHEQTGLLKHGQRQFRPLHVLGIERVSGTEQRAYGLPGQRAGQTHGFHAVQNRAGQLVAGAAPAGGKQQGQLMASHAGGQHIRGQSGAAGVSHAAQKSLAKGKASLSGQFLAISQTQGHKPHAQTVQRSGPAVGLGRIVQMGAHPRGLVLHTRKQDVFRGQTGDRVRARGPDAGQIFQAERHYSRQDRQQRSHFTRAHAVEHEHAQRLFLPDQRQQKTPLTRQKLRRVRRIARGEIQGVPAERKKGGQTAAQQAFHIHQIAAREIQILLHLLHLYSVDAGRLLV